MALSTEETELQAQERLLQAKADTETAGTKAAWAAPAVTIGAQLAAPIIAAIPAKLELDWRRQHAESKVALRKSGKLNANQQAQAQAIQAQYEAKARAVMARGSAAGGRAGANRTEARQIRQEGHRARAKYLSGARKQNLGQMALLGKQVRAESSMLAGMAARRKAAVAKGVGGAATSAATSKAMKQWGDIRRQKAGEKREAGLAMTQQEIAAARLAEKARRQSNAEATTAGGIDLGTAATYGREGIRFTDNEEV